MKIFNVSIHDVTKSTLPQVEKLKSFLIEEGIEKISYLLVPRYHEKESLLEVKEEIKELVSNGEPVLHGYSHLGKNYSKLSPMKLFTSNEGEFISYSGKELERRIVKGVRILKEIGIKPKVFIPPAWLFRKEVVEILKREKIEILGTRLFLVKLNERKKILSPPITFGSREPLKALSKRSLSLQVKVYSYLLKLLRVALHPKDIEDKEKMNLLKKNLKKLKASRKNVFLSETFKGEYDD